jgi:hypothetical protein
VHDTFNIPITLLVSKKSQKQFCISKDTQIQNPLNLELRPWNRKPSVDQNCQIYGIGSESEREKNCSCLSHLHHQINYDQTIKVEEPWKICSSCAKFHVFPSEKWKCSKTPYFGPKNTCHFEDSPDQLHRVFMPF